MASTKRHEEKLNFILEKGMDVLWQKGYNGTSVKDIVESAEVPKGSFYFYFDSKEDFAIKAIYKYFEMTFLPAQSILEDKSVPAKQRLINFYEFIANEMKERTVCNCYMGCMATNIGNEVGGQNENIRQVIADIQIQLQDKLIAVAKEAQEAGEIDPSTDVAGVITFIEDASKGAFMSMKITQDMQPLDNVLNMIKTVLFR